MQVTQTKRGTPPRILIYGPHKIGKSSFASQADAPVFVQTEDGLDAIEAQAFPLAQKWDDILGALAELYQVEHTHKTVVIDSLDWAEKLAHAHVCLDQDVSGIEKIGYGKGYSFTADLFTELLTGLNALRQQKGMTIILLAHAEIRRFDDPLADAYDRYQVKTHKLVSKLVQEWCDVIGFAQLDAVTKTEEKKGFEKGEKRTRAITTGRRVLHLNGSASFDAGNRYGIAGPVDLTWAAFDAALKAARE